MKSFPASPFPWGWLLIGILLAACARVHAGDTNAVPPPDAAAAAAAAMMEAPEVIPESVTSPLSPDHTNRMDVPFSRDVTRASVTGVVDRTWSSVSETLLRGVDWLDQRLDRMLAPEAEEHSRTLNRFYGDRRPADAGSGSSINVAPFVEYTEEGLEFAAKFRGRLDLQRLKDRVQIVFDNMTDDRDALSDVRSFSSSDPGTQKENSESVALRIKVLENIRYDVDATGGLAFDPGPIPELKLRGRAKREFEAWRFALSETLFWDNDDEFGERTEFQIGRLLGPRYVARWTSSCVWSETSDGVNLGTTLSLSHKLSERRTVSVTAGAGWITDPAAVVDEYILRIPYRQLVYRNWVYIVVEPGLDALNEDDWEPAPQLILRLEMLFGAP